MLPTWITRWIATETTSEGGNEKRYKKKKERNEQEVKWREEKRKNVMKSVNAYVRGGQEGRLNCSFCVCCVCAVCCLCLVWASEGSGREEKNKSCSLWARFGWVTSTRRNGENILERRHAHSNDNHYRAAQRDRHEREMRIVGKWILQICRIDFAKSKLIRSSRYDTTSSRATCARRTEQQVGMLNSGLSPIQHINIFITLAFYF